MALISVSEAAEILGVDKRQVRRLASAGLLVGRRTSSGWFLDEGSVRRRAAQHARAGRPLSAPIAWALLRALDDIAKWDATGEKLDVREVVAGLARDAGLSPPAARRLSKHLLRLSDEQAFVNLVRRRAQVRRYWAHPGVVGELAQEPSASLGGAKALAALEGIAEGSSPLLVYVAESDGSALVAKYHARPDPTGNVELALVPSNVPEALRPEPGKLTSASVTYTDALGADDARARESARVWYRKVNKALSMALAA